MVDSLIASTRSRTVMSFDFGLSRIGIAVGQELTATAHPLTTLRNRSQHPDWNKIGELIAEWQPDLLVIGIPYHADGGSSTVTDAALQFSRQLQRRHQITVETIDERLSSYEAECRTIQDQLGWIRRGKPPVDHVAAAVILETWFHQLNQQRNTPSATGH